MAVSFGTISSGAFVNSSVSLQDGILVTNLLGEAGSAENTGWQLISSDMSYSQTHVKYGSYALMLHGNPGFPETVCTTSNTYTPVVNHIYYARFEGYQETYAGQNVQIYWPVAEPSFGTLPIGPANQWNMYSFRSDRNSLSGTAGNFRIDYDNVNAEGYMWSDGMTLVDLTADFGSGNEPDKEWCDANIPFTTSSIALLVQEAYNGTSI